MLTELPQVLGMSPHQQLQAGGHCLTPKKLKNSSAKEKTVAKTEARREPSPAIPERGGGGKGKLGELRASHELARGSLSKNMKVNAGKNGSYPSPARRECSAKSNTLLL